MRPLERALNRGWVLRCPAWVGPGQPPPWLYLESPLAPWAVAPGGPRTPGACEFSGQQERVPGREGGGGAYRGSSAWPAHPPPPHPLLSWGRARCHELRQQPLPSCQRRSGRQRPHQHTWAPLHPATVPPRFPLPPPSPRGTTAQGVASGLQTTGSKPPESVPLK